MAPVNEIAEKIKYQSDPKLQKQFGSFEKYYEYQTLQLKRESAWTYGKNLSESIKEKVADWVEGKKDDRDEAEVRYELAMQRYSQAKKEYDNALKQLQNKQAAYGEDTSKYGDELKALNNSYDSKFDADISADCARDHLNSANSAYAKVSWMG